MSTNLNLPQIENIKQEENLEIDIDKSFEDPLKLNENYENGIFIKIKKEEFSDTETEDKDVTGETVLVEIKIENIDDIPNNFPATPENSNQQKNWEINCTAIKVENDEFDEMEVDTQKSNATNHPYIKTEIDIDDGIFDAEKRVYNNDESNTEIHFDDKLTKIIEDKAFTQTSNLNTYQLIHRWKTPHVCNFCSKSFSSQGHLARHMLTHTNEKPHVCDECGKCLSTKSHLNRHKLTHTGIRPYSCDVCSISFTRASHLDRHKMIHTGERPYSCDICNKTFSRVSHLTRHIFTHTGEKPFTCNDCGKSFTRAEHLKAHQMRHLGFGHYACNMCSKEFKSLHTLEQHKLIHTSATPHVCDICNKKFSSARYIAVHKKIHTGENLTFVKLTNETTKLAFLH